MDIRQQVLDKLSYGLYIVTSHDGNGRLNGQVSDALMQVAAVPPRFAVSINKSELTHDFIRASGRIGVTVLAREAPQAFIGLFGFQSGRDIDKLAQAGHRIGRTGAPLVTDHAVAVYEGAVFQAVDAGTHTVFFADVEAAEMVSDTLPMTYAYYTEFLKGRIPENAPTYHGPEAQPRPGDTAGGAGGAGRYVCDICGYVYDPAKGDPDQGIQPGTPFEELPDEWVCPICGVGTDRFTAETPPPAKQEGRYVCDVCGYIYDPEKGDPDQGVDPGTSFDDLPGDWVCPVCGVGREEFSPADG